jgi:hypothetical protein
MSTRDSFPGVKRPGREAQHPPPSSAEVKEWVELYLHSPNKPSWHGAQLKHRDKFTLPLEAATTAVYLVSHSGRSIMQLRVHIPVVTQETGIYLRVCVQWPVYGLADRGSG